MNHLSRFARILACGCCAVAATLPAKATTDQTFVLVDTYYMTMLNKTDDNERTAILWNFQLKFGTTAEDWPTTITIPSSINVSSGTWAGSYPMIEIHENAFTCLNQGEIDNMEDTEDKSSAVDRHNFINHITQITVPNTVTTIGKNAFRNCESLTTVNVPLSVTALGERVFENCTSLTSINFEPNIDILPNATFNGCSSLTEITLPSTITTIGDAAFAGCTSLTSLTFTGPSISMPFEGALEGVNLEGLTVNVPAGCASGYEAFAEKGATISEAEPIQPEIGETFTVSQVPYIVTGVNPNTVSVKRGISPNYNLGLLIPPTVTYNGNIFDVTAIDQYAFQMLTSVPSISLPEGLLVIGASAFERCSSVTSITIPSTVTTIGTAAFDQSGITSITVPENVSSIGDGAFQNCSNLVSAVINASLSYKTDANGNVIGHSIGQWAFRNCSALQSVVLPENIDFIEGGTFTGCTSLTEITFSGNGPVTLNENSFSGMDLSKVNVVIPVDAPLENFSFFEGKVAKISDADGTQLYPVVEEWDPIFHESGRYYIQYVGTGDANQKYLTLASGWTALNGNGKNTPFVESKEDATIWTLEFNKVTYTDLLFTGEYGSDIFNYEEDGSTTIYNHINAEGKSFHDSKSTTVYAASNKNRVFGFYMQNKDATSDEGTRVAIIANAANSANYRWWGADGNILKATGVAKTTEIPAAAYSFMLVPYVENGADTAIDSVGVEAKAEANGAIYDLQGRRLSAPVKGINIINGRKVLVK